MLQLKRLKAPLLFIAAAMSANVSLAQAKPSPAKTAATDIPLIPRELFFDNPDVSGSELSPDGKKISFLKANHGIMNIWVKGIDEPFSKARPLTDSKEPMS